MNHHIVRTEKRAVSLARRINRVYFIRIYVHIDLFIAFCSFAIIFYCGSVLLVSCYRSERTYLTSCKLWTYVKIILLWVPTLPTTSETMMLPSSTPLKIRMREICMHVNGGLTKGRRFHGSHIFRSQERSNIVPPRLIEISTRIMDIFLRPRVW